MNIIGQNGNDGLHYDKIEPTKEDLDKLETQEYNLIVKHIIKKILIGLTALHKQGVVL